MTEPEPTPEPWKNLIDDYLNGSLDEPRMKELEDHLRADAEARRYFVRYARLDTDLHMEMRAQRAGEQALDRILQPDKETAERVRSARPYPWATVLAVAACVLLALAGGGWLLMGGRTQTSTGGEPAIAWLVNAQ